MTKTQNAKSMLQNIEISKLKHSNDKFATFWNEPPFRANLLLGEPPSRGLLYCIVPTRPHHLSIMGERTQKLEICIYNNTCSMMHTFAWCLGPWSRWKDKIYRGKAIDASIRNVKNNHRSDKKYKPTEWLNQSWNIKKTS